MVEYTKTDGFYLPYLAEVALYICVQHFLLGIIYLQTVMAYNATVVPLTPRVNTEH